MTVKSFPVIYRTKPEITVCTLLLHREQSASKWINIIQPAETTSILTQLNKHTGLARLSQVAPNYHLTGRQVKPHTCFCFASLKTHTQYLSIPSVQYPTTHPVPAASTPTLLPQGWRLVIKHLSEGAELYLTPLNLSKVTAVCQTNLVDSFHFRLETLSESYFCTCSCTRRWWRRRRRRRAKHTRQMVHPEKRRR